MIEVSKDGAASGDKNKKFYQGKRPQGAVSNKQNVGDTEMNDRNTNKLTLNMNQQRVVANLKNTPQLGSTRTAEL